MAAARTADALCKYDRSTKSTRQWGDTPIVASGCNGTTIEDDCMKCCVASEALVL